MAFSLQSAYAFIDDGDFHAASVILESLVNTDPMNIEAWEAYMQICETCEELDYLCERVLQVIEITRTDRESILDYYCFLRDKLRYSETEDETQKMVTLELVDQFNYTLKDRSSISTNGNKKVDLENQFAWFLKKAIPVPYLVLLVLSINLLSRGNNFGYWILLVLTVSAFVGIWNILFPGGRENHKSYLHELESPSMQDEEVHYHPG